MLLTLTLESFSQHKKWKTALNTQANGKMVNEMDTANKYGLTAQFTKETGSMTKLREKGSLFMETAILMKENGLMIRQTGLDYICIRMEQSTKDTG